MGLFDKFFGSKKEKDLVADGYFKTLNAYTPTFTTWGGSIYESELVRSAIEARAEHISKMEVRIDGAAKPKLKNKLKLAPNEFQTWSQFLGVLSRRLDVNNTAFIVPVIDRFDEVTGIASVLPEKCEFVEYNNVPYLRYKFANGTASIELDRCGIMTRHQYKDDLVGDSNRALRNTMELINIQNQGIEEGVKSSATYRFMAQVNNFARPEDLAKERKRFSAENLSSDGGGLLLFPNTYTNIQQINSKPFVVDAEQMRLINTNVYNYFGVNERIIQNLANADELDAFYNGCLAPFATQLEEVLTKMLFTLNEQTYGARVHVTSDRLQYMSVQNKINLITSMGDRGMITIDEARQLLNYAPLPDGKGEMIPIRGEYYDVMKGEEDEGE